MFSCTFGNVIQIVRRRPFGFANSYIHTHNKKLELLFKKIKSRKRNSIEKVKTSVKEFKQHNVVKMNSKLKSDKYCWECTNKVDGSMLGCNNCFRIYHEHCVKKADRKMVKNRNLCLVCLEIEKSEEDTK